MKNKINQLKRGTYSKEVECYNCDYKGELDIMKGVRIGDKNCPECGCNCLHKSNFSIK